VLEQCLPGALGHDIAFILVKKEFSENFKNDWQQVGKRKNDYAAELAAAADMIDMCLQGWRPNPNPHLPLPRLLSFNARSTAPL
jgi:hypothetical protein